MITRILKRKGICLALVFMVVFTGCAGGAGRQSADAKRGETEGISSGAGEILQETGESLQPEEGGAPEPEITEADWSEYFDGLHGTAVLYHAEDGRFQIYNREQAVTQTSPCSTFKIISSMVALESGIIQPEDSTCAWSGEVFWNEKWNQDIDFRQAFRESCVWYFRKVIDTIGQEPMQEALKKLSYGNCDISDWEGRRNTNNSNRALTGFWIESSLKISPKEQTEVMERIFGENAVCSEKTQKELKTVMQVTGEEALESRPEISLYGKTGMGKVQGAVVDAWFTGFAEKKAASGAKNGTETVYFCVHLGRNDGRDVSSTLAKKIAIQIVLEDGF